MVFCMLKNIRTVTFVSICAAMAVFLGVSIVLAIHKEIARQMAVVAQENADINRPHFQTARCQKPTGSQPGPVGFLYFSARLHRMWNFDCHFLPGVGGMPM